MVATKRIRNHCLCSGKETGSAVIFVHGNLSAATFFEETMLTMPAEYWCIAPDLRGYGDTEDLPIDARRGVLDLVDDLEALFNTLGISSAHLVGWSAGAGVIMQFALEHVQLVESLCLIAPVSPFGFGGSYDNSGIPTTSDYAGSGAGTVNTDVVEQIRLGNTHSSPATAPRQLLREYFVNSPAQFPREDLLVAAMLKQKLGDQRYPGDHLVSKHPPYVAPGKWGPINALSPKYFNASTLVELPDKPPVLWLRGDADRVISDHSFFDLATILRQQALLEHGLSVADSIRSQPMVSQMREVLLRYQQNGGQFEEVVMENVGHSPFLEEPDVFLRHFIQFLSASEAPPGSDSNTLDTER